MNYRDEYRKGQGEFFWTLPRAALAVVATIVVVFLILVVATPLTIGFGWYSGEANIRSFGHVKQEYAFAYRFDRAMEAEARNICIAKQEQLDPAAIAAYRQTYSNIEGEYDAQMADRFRAKRVIPPDLPSTAPDLAEREKALHERGDTC